jgi:hypothetical protein
MHVLSSRNIDVGFSELPAAAVVTRWGRLFVNYYWHVFVVGGIKIRCVQRSAFFDQYATNVKESYAVDFLIKEPTQPWFRLQSILKSVWASVCYRMNIFFYQWQDGFVLEQIIKTTNSATRMMILIFISWERFRNDGSTSTWPLLPSHNIVKPIRMSHVSKRTWSQGVLKNMLCLKQTIGYVWNTNNHT